MKYIKNEKGMALLTVILMFTVFTVLGMVVFSAIMNNTKQISKTESHIQATDLAEMGITYYKTAIKGTIIGANDTGSATIDAYYTNLNNKLDGINMKKQISLDNVFFEIQPVNDISKYNLPLSTTTKLLTNNITTYLNSESRNIGILLYSKGTVKNQDRLLSLYLKYNIKLDTKGNYTISSPGTSTSTTACGDPSKIDGINCVYETPQLFEGDLNNIKDSTLYFEDDFSVTGTIVNVQGGKIHVEGDFKASEINNFQDDTVDKVSIPAELEIEGNAEIGTINNTSNNFKLLVGGDLFVNEIGNSVRDYSTFIILGTANIKSGLENITGTCKLCAFNGVVGYMNNTADRIFVPEDPNFNEICGSYGGEATYILKTIPEEIIDYH